MSSAEQSPPTLAALADLARRGLHADGPDLILDALVAASHAALATDQVHVSEVSQDAAVGRARVVGFESETPHTEHYTQVIDDRPSGVAHVVASGRTLEVEDARASSLLRPDLTERFGARSSLFVPVAFDQDVRLVLILVRRTVQPFTRAEVDLAEALAAVAATSLAREETERRAAARGAREEALARAAQVLAAAADRLSALEGLSREAAAAVGGDLAGFYLGEPGGGGVATAGHNTPSGWRGVVLEPGEGIGGQVLATGRAVVATAYQDEIRLPDVPGLRDLRTGVGVPVTADGRLIGALSVGFYRMRRVMPEDLRTLQALADLGAVAATRLP